jgi:hypothetical protein
MTPGSGHSDSTFLGTQHYAERCIQGGSAVDDEFRIMSCPSHSGCIAIELSRRALAARATSIGESISGFDRAARLGVGVSSGRNFQIVVKKAVRRTDIVIARLSNGRWMKCRQRSTGVETRMRYPSLNFASSGGTTQRVEPRDQEIHDVSSRGGPCRGAGWVIATRINDGLPR